METERLKITKATQRRKYKSKQYEYTKAKH